MKHFRNIGIFIVITILLGITFHSVYAQIQPDIKIDTATVSLLPEYNQPTVLVVYEIILDEATSLPQTLIFEVPADAKVLSVINFTQDNRPYELSFNESYFGHWKEVRFTATSHNIHIEYQDPNLIRSQDQRTYEFRWLSAYPVSTLVINVHRPLGASNIYSQPPFEVMSSGLENISTLSSNFGKIEAGELFSLSISYHKDPGDLGYPALSVSPVKPIEENITGKTLSPIFVILWMLLFSVAIVTIVGFYFFRFKIKEENNEFDQIGLGEVIINPEKQTLFCTECGIRIKAGDNYCSNCGTELRKLTPFESPLHQNDV